MGTPARGGDGYPPMRKDLSTRIHRVGGYNKGKGYTYYPVVIAGAGFAGIGMAHKLKHDLKFDQFRVFERQAGIGGTWWINRYPGVACDVPAVFYSYSFAPNPKWTSFYPPGPEIYDYLQDITDRFGLTEKIELNTDVRICRWLKDEEVWEITLAHMRPGMGDISNRERSRKIKEEGEESVWVSTEIIRAKILISGVGGIVEPKVFPDDVPGFSNFKGKCFHSNRWDYSVDFNDKNVVVLGTGCSAAQVVPKLLRDPYNAKSVTQIMRSPPWVVARAIPPGGNKNWAKYAPTVLSNFPGVLKTLRLLVFTEAEWTWRIFPDNDYGRRERKKMEEAEIIRMKSTVPKAYHEMLTPDYSIACKRRIFDKDWFETMNDPKYELTTQQLSEVHEDSVTLGPGRVYPKASKGEDKAREIPADIIVLANGFDMTRWLTPLEVRGTEGQDLVDTMQERGGPQAYQGTAVDGFPNFFIIYGPNTTTGHSSVVLCIENMVNYAAKFVKPILSGDIKTAEVKKEAELAWTEDIQKQLKKTVFHTGGCSSWYFDKTGWNSTVLPYNQVWFWYRCVFPRWHDWNVRYTTKGLTKLILSRLLKLSAMVFFLLGWYRARKDGLSLNDYFEETKTRFVSIGKLLTVVAIDKARKQLKNAKDFVVHM